MLQRPQAQGRADAGPRPRLGRGDRRRARRADCVPVAATDPLYILYTSGTTGQPKGIVRDNGGHAVALHWSMEHVYDVAPGEVYWAASDVGWVVGHSYIVLRAAAARLHHDRVRGQAGRHARCRRVLAGDRAARRGCLFTAPTAFRAIKKEDPDGAPHRPARSVPLSHAVPRRRALRSRTRCDWAEAKLQRPVIDHWWQTETGWAIAANCWGIEQLPVKAGSPTKAVPGYDVRVLDEAGDEQQAAARSATSWSGCRCRRARCRRCGRTTGATCDAYLARYPGYYLTGDAGYRDEDGYLYVMSRIDDVINVAGHRLSTGAMEEVLAAHPDVAECAVFGVADELKGELPLGLVVLKAGVDRPEAEIATRS